MPSSSTTTTTTIKLHGFAKRAPDTPSGSFFCQKLETHLRLASFPRANYTLVDALPFRQPKGKLPCVTLSRPGAADVFLEDSHFILRALAADGVIPDVDAPLGLSAAQRADARAWQAWTEELVYAAVVCTRWLRPANYARSAAALPVPAPVRPFLAWFLHRRISTRLRASGVGMHSDAELDAILEEWVDGLDARLADGRQWFHGGDTPSSADVMLGSLLMNCAGEEANPEFNAMWMRRERVRAYAERCTRQWFPEYEGVLQLLRKTTSLFEPSDSFKFMCVPPGVLLKAAAQLKAPRRMTKPNSLSKHVQAAAGAFAGLRARSIVLSFHDTESRLQARDY
ncbi:hypothetical protein AURDEDRAFT_130757 [Auricularia subglabra TFB-10046 SS5]|uniref:Thioredoxin-like fold domain-containing protein n=1 Tax=Auricularia subglabra (strain TFB-10046 / SS5) TaxID=717982 RepID=J0CX11_AURST|nr:hypothetical protein AURDEDRAFT_130757 [Auricularia subglabra TFB-10046 SS5]